MMLIFIKIILFFVHDIMVQCCLSSSNRMSKKRIPRVSGVAPTRKHPCRISPSCHLASWTGWSLSWDTCCDCRMKFHWTLRPNCSCASCDYLWTSMCFLLGWIRFELAMILSAFCISSVVIRDPSLRTIYQVSHRKKRSNASMSIFPLHPSPC